MQTLADKYNIGIEIKDQASFNKAYKKISLNTHPDRWPGREEDFMKASELHKPSSPGDGYSRAMEGLHKANIIIKFTDTVIDVTRLTINPTTDNALKTIIDSAQCIGLYNGNHLAMWSGTAVNAAYHVYNEDYKSAASSILMSVGFTLMSMAVASKLPVLSALAFTGYATYSMLDNGYDLYNEWSCHVEQAMPQECMGSAEHISETS
jgi:hypothetical protein